MIGVVRKAIRTFILFFPAVSEFRHVVHRWLRTWRGQPHEMDFWLLKKLPSGLQGEFLDLGANRGQSTASIKVVYPDARVVAFEPNPNLAKEIEARYQTDASVTVHNMALSDDTGEIELHVPVYRGCPLDGLASLDRENARTWLDASRIYLFNPDKIAIQSHLVSVSKLDNFDFKPAFIKIDVQGYELPVLRGGERTLLASKPLLLIESAKTGDPVSTWLSERGFRIAAYNGSSLVVDQDGGLNSFFIHEDRLNDWSYLLA